MDSGHVPLGPGHYKIPNPVQENRIGSLIETYLSLEVTN
uniref:Uncharacterized protein n=1 Tax=Tarenaya spinosa TaxID=228870 RepID=Q1KUQ3_9ROSI|nr:hypothetical protein [Tarenaya spinosa]